MDGPRTSDRKRSQTQFQGATETHKAHKSAEAQAKASRARAAAIAAAYETLGGLVQLGEAGGGEGSIWVGEPGEDGAEEPEPSRQPATTSTAGSSTSLTSTATAACYSLAALVASRAAWRAAADSVARAATRCTARASTAASTRSSRPPSAPTTAAVAVLAALRKVGRRSTMPELPEQGGPLRARARKLAASFFASLAAALLNISRCCFKQATHVPGRRWRGRRWHGPGGIGDLVIGGKQDVFRLRGTYNRALPRCGPARSALCGKDAKPCSPLLKACAAFHS
jgi:hypothetical protein